MRNLYQSWQQGWKSKFGIDFDDFDARASKSSKFFIKIDFEIKLIIKVPSSVSVKTTDVPWSTPAESSLWNSRKFDKIEKIKNYDKNYWTNKVMIINYYLNIFYKKIMQISRFERIWAIKIRFCIKILFQNHVFFRFWMLHPILKRMLVWWKMTRWTLARLKKKVFKTFEQICRNIWSKPTKCYPLQQCF